MDERVPRGVLCEGWHRPARSHTWHWFIGVDSVCRLWIDHVPAWAPALPAEARECLACRRWLAGRRVRGKA